MEKQFSNRRAELRAGYRSQLDGLAVQDFVALTLTILAENLAIPSAVRLTSGQPIRYEQLMAQDPVLCADICVEELQRNEAWHRLTRIENVHDLWFRFTAFFAAVKNLPSATELSDAVHLLYFTAQILALRLGCYEGKEFWLEEEWWPIALSFGLPVEFDDTIVERLSELLMNQQPGSSHPPQLR